MLKCTDVKKTYDKVIFENISIDIDSKITFLIGENGSGKTTLLNILAKQDEKFEGTIKYEGINNIVYLSQENKILNDLTVKQNIELFANQIDVPKLNMLLNNFNMNEKYKSKQKVGALSGGEKKKLHIIIGLLRTCDLLIIDEVENHIDRESIKQFINIINELECQIIISSHTLDEYMEEENIDFSILRIEDMKVRSEKKSKDAVQHKEQPLNISTLTDEQNKLLLIVGKKIRLTLAISIFLIISMFTTIIYSQIYTIISNVHGLDTSLKFGETSTLVYPPAFSSNFYSLGDKSALETTPLFFTEDNLEMIKKLPYVTNVEPVTPKAAGVVNNAYEENGKLYLHNSKPMGFQNKVYSFENLRLNPEILSNIPFSYYINGTSLEYGELPETNTNQILIDEYYAEYYVEQLGLDNINQLVNQVINIDVENQGKTEKKDFVVSGIYKSIDNGVYSVYTAVNTSSDYYKKRVEYWDNLDYDAVVGQIDTVVEYVLNGDYSLYENYYAENETYYEGFYITVEDSSNIKELTDKVWEYDPFIEVLNNYSIKHYPVFTYLKSTIVKSTIFILLLIICAVIINSLLFYYYNNATTDVIKKLNFYKFEQEAINKYETTILKHFYRMLIIAFTCSLLVIGYKTRLYGWEYKELYLIIIIIYLIAILLSRFVNEKIKRGKK